MSARSSSPTLTALLKTIAERNRQLPPVPVSLVPEAEALAGLLAEPPASGDALRDMTTAAMPPAEREPAIARDVSVDEIVERLGLLPQYRDLLIEHCGGRQGSRWTTSAADHWPQVVAWLTDRWRPPRLETEARMHVFIGPAGSGKTTCLSKWLVQTVLTEGRSAGVVRLDSDRANTAEMLSVLCNALGVSCERSWTLDREALPERVFVDLPGMDWREPGAPPQWAARLAALGLVQVHLVLNAAYDTRLLFAQIEAFQSLPVTDLIFTHLDEELRWGKLWNFVLGTNWAIRLLGAGQNVPGLFLAASPATLIAGESP